MKSPLCHHRGFNQMERAKRLELIISLLQACLDQRVYDTAKCLDAQRDAHETNPAFSRGKVAAWAADLDEVVHAWPSIDSNVQTGLLAIVRSQKIAPT